MLCLVSPKSTEWYAGMGLSGVRDESVRPRLRDVKKGRATGGFVYECWLPVCVVAGVSRPLPSSQSNVAFMVASGNGECIFIVKQAGSR